MKIYLRDRNLTLCNYWKDIFSKEPDVNVSCGDIFEEGEHLNVDAIVSPANSLGFMDGGIDYVYSEYFGWKMSSDLQEHLWQHHDGELLVGQAAIIDIRKSNANTKIPYLISAPTMRVPMDVSKTVNAYLAFVATLRVAMDNGIKSLLCPGLGTAIGKMPYDICAVQMYEAYKRYDKPRRHDLLGDAYIHHQAMMNSRAYLTGGYKKD